MKSIKTLLSFLFKAATDSRATLGANLKVLETQNIANNARIATLNEQIADMTKACQSIQAQVAVSNKAIAALSEILKEGEHV
jgi:flagellar hook-basal body complex protein FliE